MGVCSTPEPNLSSLSDPSPGWRREAARGQRGALGHHHGHSQCGGRAGHGPCLRGHALLRLCVRGHPSGGWLRPSAQCHLQTPPALSFALPKDPPAGWLGSTRARAPQLTGRPALDPSLRPQTGRFACGSRPGKKRRLVCGARTGCPGYARHFFTHSGLRQPGCTCQPFKRAEKRGWEES